jgi:hypothetical protein
MLSNKEVCENFEVRLNTLYNWKKTKPKLYKYLQNADFNFERSKEINILLERFAKDISYDFKIEEIEYIINSSIDFRSIDEIDNISVLFIKSEYLRLSKNSDIILSIYDKLKNMNIVEKYIFYKKIYRYRKSTTLDIAEFFKEFLK